jgi:hypothetical protein
MILAYYNKNKNIYHKGNTTINSQVYHFFFLIIWPLILLNEKIKETSRGEFSRKRWSLTCDWSKKNAQKLPIS